MINIKYYLSVTTLQKKNKVSCTTCTAIYLYPAPQKKIPICPARLPCTYLCRCSLSGIPHTRALSLATPLMMLYPSAFGCSGLLPKLYTTRGEPERFVDFDECKYDAAAAATQAVSLLPHSPVCAYVLYKTKKLDVRLM